jgi:hypothetical protein
MGVNLGLVDRITRVVVGIALAGVGLFVVKGIFGIALAVVGAVLIFSGTVGFCHVYKFFGICSTAKKS